MAVCIPAKEEAWFVSLFYLNNSWSFSQGTRCFWRVHPSPVDISTTTTTSTVSTCTYGLHVLSREPGPRWLSPGRVRERGEGDGCQVAKMQKKSGCGRGLPLRRGRSDVCRLEDFLRGERERESHFIDPWNRSTTKILSNTSSTGWKCAAPARDFLPEELPFVWSTDEEGFCTRSKWKFFQILLLIPSPCFFGK